MWHPTEDDLILHFYGEDRDVERRIDEHLGECALCRASWADLRDTLNVVDSAAAPEPPEGFERVMWARVEQALVPFRRPTLSWWRPLVPTAALAAGLVVVIGLGVWWINRPADVATSTPASRADAADDRRERVLLTALNDHFQQTELLLVELLNAPETERLDFAFERTTADDLVASGRLYRMTAEQTGHPQLVQMLDDLEAVLVEVARSPERLSRQDFKSLQTRIDEDGLLFKVRAVNTEIQKRQQDLNNVAANPVDEGNQ